MVRSFSNVKLLSAFAVDGGSLAFNRRGYAAASSSMVKGGETVRSGIVGKRGEERGIEKEGSSWWLPDLITGYYRPENSAGKMGVVEHREIQLNNHKISPL